MKTAIIASKNNQVSLQTPYDPQFLTALKSEIDYQARKWDREEKVWLVDETEAEKAIEITKRFFSVQDLRGKSESEAEEAALDAEIAKIEADQQYILDSKERIDEILAALDTAIGRYSFSSKSSIKGRMCRDRALLRHSLDNAKTPVEKLVELQVRGLAAAVRLLETETVASLTAR